MDSGELARQIKSGMFKGSIEKDLPVKLIADLEKMDSGDIEKLIRRIMTIPVKFNNEDDRKLYQLYFSASWFNIFEKLVMPKNLSVLEIATGDENYVLKALDAYSGNLGKYITFNINRELTKKFIAKTGDITADIRVIEDNGKNALNYIEKDSLDVIAFHHAINDIIQTIIADIEGIDTVNCDWWETENKMLHAVMRYYNSGKLKEAAYGGFIEIINVCSQVLKKNGYMIFDNCSFAGYEKRGYSTEFHSSYIGLAREWIKEADIGLREVKIKGYDEKWWMVLTKI